MILVSHDYSTVALLVFYVVSFLQNLLGGSAFSSRTTARTHQQHPVSVERLLAENASPLVACGTSEDAVAQMLQEGVCRLNDIISKQECTELRNRILEFKDNNNHAFEDMRNIPGTRLRFSEPVIAPLNQRTDILLPIEDEIVGRVLQKLIHRLGPTLEAASKILPGANSMSNNDECNHHDCLELVEAACLISEYTATDQELHADYRRDSPNAETRLPPRLVTFLYLQDSPTMDHGPTVFLPSTNTFENHCAYFQKETKEKEHANDDGLLSLARCATLNAGDVAIYDASVLHFGSRNNVPDNTRLVFYFGVAIQGTRSLAASASSSSLVNLEEPILLKRMENGKRRFVHSAVCGMEQ